MRVDFNHQTRLYLGLYELEIARHCKRLLQQCGNAFDIGGNNGYYTFILGKHTGGKVINAVHCAKPLVLLRFHPENSSDCQREGKNKNPGGRPTPHINGALGSTVLVLPQRPAA